MRNLMTKNYADTAPHDPDLIDLGMCVQIYISSKTNEYGLHSHVVRDEREDRFNTVNDGNRFSKPYLAFMRRVDGIFPNRL